MNLFRSLAVLALVAVVVSSCAPGYTPATTNQSPHLALGNPSNAQTNPSSYDNYLLNKPQFALSYNRSKGHANWVAWELSPKWLGTIDRQNDFRPDEALPQDWPKIKPSDYSSSGFDRGHLCPSADRTNSIPSNSSTFLMTNMIPQAPDLNREAWEHLEQFSRELVEKGYKLYITAGAYGTGGEGSKGTATKLDDVVNVPARVYKIIVVLPGNASVNEINSTTPVIAVDFPNKNSTVKNTSWIRYITTVSELERKTGMDFFSNLPSSTQSALQNARFDYRSTSINVDTKCSVYNGNALYIGKSGGCYYLTASGKKTYVDRDLCDCK
ncbi:endonuclease G [Runella defluvii]|uniref:Endonuclease n=1 Tax=Runella defluvii TaxID=370973 RepID=A0A7W6EPN8_9BACT|nr:DNA/RNA non-specific endonuclease [Runella defluvii]MBB3837825.1 endonuclease G [Runella defluvii]